MFNILKKMYKKTDQMASTREIDMVCLAQMYNNCSYHMRRVYVYNFVCENMVDSYINHVKNDELAVNFPQ